MIHCEEMVKMTGLHQAALLKVRDILYPEYDLDLFQNLIISWSDNTNIQNSERSVQYLCRLYESCDHFHQSPVLY